jgi:hypothetical protein
LFDSRLERQLDKGGDRIGSEIRRLGIFCRVGRGRISVFLWPSLCEHVQCHQTLVAESIDFFLDVLFHFLGALLKLKHLRMGYDL